MKINALLGVAGVHPLESEQAKRIGRMFEFLVLIALLIVFAQIVLLYDSAVQESQLINNMVWLVFFAELVVNLYNVEHRARYLKENWLNVAIVCVAFPGLDWGADWAVIIRSLRLILFVRFFTSFFRDIVSILNRNRFGQVLVASAFIILGAGAIFSYIEDRDYLDGIWYALVTITTVGYGDVVPASQAGRVFGMFLILFGVVFFSLVTANIAAYLIGSEQRKLEEDILQYMKATDNRLARQQATSEEHVEKIIMHMSQEIELLKQELQEIKEMKSTEKKLDEKA